MTIVKAEQSHIWEREAYEHYVEPLWCSQRLFEVEQFEGRIWDPACGFGRIPYNAFRAGYRDVLATDIIARNESCRATWDFLQGTGEKPSGSVVSNPPFDIFKIFAEQALRTAEHKVALIWLVRTLPAAHWLRDTPLKKILYLTPRPSMPPGHVIAAGENPGGGKQDFCWLIWEHDYKGDPTTGWLHRDGRP